MSKNSRQITVCMSGFVHDPQQQSYKKMLQQIGCKYVDQLSLEVDYLIVNHTCTQKYKIAQLINSKIQCIMLKWLEDCVKSGKILPAQKYKINKIFYGVKIIMEGFQDKKISQKIIEILKNNGVEQIRVGVQGMKTQQLTEKFNLILIPSVKLYRKLEHRAAEYLIVPIVTPEWLQQSMKAKICKYPNDYALNYHNISVRAFDDNTNYKRLNIKLQNFMSVDFLNTQNAGLLCDQKSKQQLIIYLDPNSIDKTFADLLKKLICVNGGLYLNVYGPVVTHVLVGVIQQNQYYKFMNYGDSSYVLRVQWLIDSILCSERLPQIDFKIRSFKTAYIKSSDNLQLRQVYHQQLYQQQSQNFISFYQSKKYNSSHFASLQIAPKLDKKIQSISVSINQEQAKVAKVVPVTKIKQKSDMFKNKYFFIPKSQRKQSIMQTTFTKIKQNGGINIGQNSIPQIKNKKLFLVLRDSDENEQLVQQMLKNIQQKSVEIVPVSTRWVQECIKKGNYMQHNAQNYFIFKPFMFKTPVKQLMTMKIQILGVEQVLKRRYKQLLVALGANKISPNIAQITHCLCGGSYLEDPRYQSITKSLVNPKQSTSNKVVGVVYNSNNIKLVKIQWVMELVNNKAKIPIDEFVIGNLQPLKT